VKPLSYTPVNSYSTAKSNATVAGSTGLAKGTSAPSASSSPIYTAGASGLQVGSGMALIVVAVAALFL
jgi:hypothetical protein